MKHLHTLILALIIICSLPHTISATSVLPQNLAQLSENAESAFVIRIESIETSTSQNRHFDIITGIITEPVFGNVTTSQTISWQQFRFSQRASLAGMPRYQPGREYLIFLSGTGRGTPFQMPVGLQQGAFEILRNPTTGAALARNAIGNISLTTGLDVNTVARDIATQQVQTRTISPADQTAREATLKRQLRPHPSGASLETLKQAARHFHQQKQTGRSPAIHYHTTTTATLRPLHI